MITQAENITKYSRVKRQTDHGQTELNNMLVKKIALNEINKEGTFTQGFKDWRKIKRKVSQNLDDLQNLLINLTLKASAEKAWLLYKSPVSLNSGNSSLHPVGTEDQFKVNSKENWWGISEAAK